MSILKKEIVLQGQNVLKNPEIIQKNQWGDLTEHGDFQRKNMRSHGSKKIVAEHFFNFRAARAIFLKNNFRTMN